jgi:anti-sigma-K factor RskA
VATGEENAAGPSAEAPAFAFRPGDEAERGRRARRRERRRARAGARRAPWASRGLAAVLAVLALVLAGMLLQTRDRLAQAEQFTDTWATLSLTAGAELVPGLSDNGTWQAVVSEDGVALRAEGVAGWDGEVLELWGVSDGVTRSLGVLDLSARGEIAFTSAETAERLVVTREMAPGSGSGSPSPRLVATLDPELTGA